VITKKKKRGQKKKEEDRKKDAGQKRPNLRQEFSGVNGKKKTKGKGRPQGKGKDQPISNRTIMTVLLYGG